MPYINGVQRDQTKYGKVLFALVGYGSHTSELRHEMWPSLLTDDAHSQCVPKHISKKWGPNGSDRWTRRSVDLR